MFESVNFRAIYTLYIIDQLVASSLPALLPDLPGNHVFLGKTMRLSRKIDQVGNFTTFPEKRFQP